MSRPTIWIPGLDMQSIRMSHRSDDYINNVHLLQSIIFFSSSLHFVIMASPPLPPPPPPTSVDSRGTYAHSLSWDTPYLGKTDGPFNMLFHIVHTLFVGNFFQLTPYLRNIMVTPIPFLLFYFHIFGLGKYVYVFYRQTAKHTPFPEKWECACGPIVHFIGGGGGVDCIGNSDVTYRRRSECLSTLRRSHSNNRSPRQRTVRHSDMDRWRIHQYLNTNEREGS